MGDKPYPILCAWCLEKGKETIVGYSEVEGSHGMCERHTAEFLEQAQKFAEKQRRQQPR